LKWLRVGVKLVINWGVLPNGLETLPKKLGKVGIDVMFCAELVKFGFEFEKLGIIVLLYAP